MPGLRIGQLASRADVTPATIRYYERIGLLPPPRRSEGGYRQYLDTALDELRFIRKAQGLGFSLDEVREILGLTRSGRSACTRVLSLTEQHLEVVEARIGQLQQFRDHLRSELARWSATDPALTCEGLCRFIAGSEQGQQVPQARKADEAGSSV